MTVSANGFRTFKQGGIDLTVGRMPNLDIKLEVGAVAETVEVSGAAPLVDTTQSKVAVTVQRETMDNLPKGRSFQSLIPFAPGARLEPLQSGTATRIGLRRFPDRRRQRLGKRLHGRRREHHQHPERRRRQRASRWTSSRKFRSSPSSFEAEYGGALGGVINVVPQARFQRLARFALQLPPQQRVQREQPRSRPANQPDSAFRRDVISSLRRPAPAGWTPRPSTTWRTRTSRPSSSPVTKSAARCGRTSCGCYSSYIPSIDTTRRVTNFTGANPGPRTLTQTRTDQNAYNRLDYGVTNSLRVFGSWNYGYWRQTGTLGGAGQPRRTDEHRPYDRSRTPSGPMPAP